MFLALKITDGIWCKRQTDRLLGNSGPVIRTFYGTDEMRHIFTCLVTCILLTTGMNLKWLTRVLQTTEDTRLEWNSKWHIFQILQPFQKSAYYQSYCFLQRKGDFQPAHTKEMQAFWHQNFRLCDSTGYMCDMKVHLGKDSAWHST